MKTWVVATCIAIGLMVLIDSSAAMPPQKIFICMMAAFYDQSETELMEQGLEAVVGHADFIINVDEPGNKYDQFSNNDEKKFPLKVLRDGVFRYISRESYVGSFNSILRHLKVKVLTVAGLTKDIENKIPVGQLIWIMFITIAGKDGRIQKEEYTHYVEMFVPNPNEDDVNQTWKKINPDADKGQPGSLYCDLTEFQEACTTVGIAGQISVALYH